MVKRLYLQIIKRIIIKKYNRKNGCNICTSHISIKQLQNINCGVLIGKKCVFADPAGSISIGDYTYMNSGYSDRSRYGNCLYYAVWKRNDGNYSIFMSGCQ